MASKKPVYQPDNSTSPHYPAALAFALKWADRLAAKCNPFDIPAKHKELHMWQSATYEPLHAFNNWPRNIHYNYNVIPEWCPLTASQRRNKLVIVRLHEPDSIFHDVCFVFDPAELARQLDMTPEHAAVVQRERDDRALQREEEHRLRTEQWQAELAQLYLERETEEGRLAARQRQQRETAAALRKQQPTLF